MIDSTELAWAAGFYDGEGSCYVNHTRKSGKESPPKPLLSVSQSTPGPLERWIRATELGKLGGPYKPKYPNGKPYYVVQVNKVADVKLAVYKMWFWLSEPKRQQFLRVVDEIARWDLENPGRRRCKKIAQLS